MRTIPADLAERHNLPAAVVRDMRARIGAHQRDLHGRLQDLLPEGSAPPDDEADAA